MIVIACCQTQLVGGRAELLSAPSVSHLSPPAPSPPPRPVALTNTPARVARSPGILLYCYCSIIVHKWYSKVLMSLGRSNDLM